MGDSFNDYPAFVESAIAIGIKPKNKDLWQYCHYITKNKTEGVTEAIYWLLTKEKGK